MSVTDINSMMEEILNEDLPETYTMGDDLCSEMMRAEKIKSNTRATVFNLKVSPGGDFKGIDYEDGALPVGNHFVTKKPTVSSIGMVLGFNVPWLGIWATKGRDLAIRPLLEEQMAATAATWKLWLESLLNAATNDGVLARWKTGSVAPAYSLENAPDGDTYTDGGILLQPGGRYEVRDTTLATLRASGPYRIDPDGGLDLTAGAPPWSSPVVTFTVSIAGSVTGDKIVAQDLVNASINPVAYHANGSSSGTWQALSRSKIYTRGQRVDGASQQLTPKIMRDLHNQILMFKGDPAATSKLRPYMHHRQYQNYQNAAQDISQIILGGVGPSAVNKNFDLMVGEGRIEGKNIILGNHCDPTRAYFLDFSKFRWVETKAPGFLTNPEGNGYFFNVHSTTLGTAKASQSWYFGAQIQLGCVDATGLGVIDTLALP